MHVGKGPLAQENLFDDGRQTPTRVGRAPRWYPVFPRVLDRPPRVEGRRGLHVVGIPDLREAPVRGEHPKTIVVDRGKVDRPPRVWGGPHIVQLAALLYG